MEFKDYYDLLGVTRNADEQEIKTAYRKLARKYHPDVSKEADAETRFKNINEAYEVLKDPQKRSAYDRLGKDWQAGQEFRPPPDWYKQFQFDERNMGGSGFSDFFESLFGRSFQNNRQQHYRVKGEDQHATITIDIEDAYHGVSKTITLNSDARNPRPRNLNVKIPKGVMAGQKIRLAEQGQAGLGSKGDLLLEIAFNPHPLYRIEQRDLYMDLPITPWEAALGANVTVPTLGGKVDLKIAPGTRSGQKLRLRGRGLPGTSDGDQYLVLQIVTPLADTPSAREFYQKMAQELPLNPRAELGV